MKQNTDSIQNRFTAYLVTAVTNKRLRYMENKKRWQEWELKQADLLDRKYTDFEQQLQYYRSEQSATLFESGIAISEGEELHEVFAMFESKRLIKVLAGLKEREQKIMFARVFGELTFSELGEKFGMKPKQAEMAYYYIIRKIRKELEVSKKHEI